MCSNLLVTKAPGEERPKIAILDAGMAVELEPTNHVKLLHILMAFVKVSQLKDPST